MIRVGDGENGWFLQPLIPFLQPLIQIPMIGYHIISPLFWPCQPLKAWHFTPRRTTFHGISGVSRKVGTSEICDPSRTWHGFPEPPQMPNPHVLCLVATPKTQRIGCWLCQFWGGPLHCVFFSGFVFYLLVVCEERVHFKLYDSERFWGSTKLKSVTWW